MKWQMGIQELKNKLVAVLGNGQEGQATANYLIKHGIKPVLFDQRPWEEWPDAEQDKIKTLGVNFIFGPDALKELAGFDVAFRSPGIPLSHPDLVKWLGYDLSLNPSPSPGEGNPILTSQTKYFFDNCPCKIIGVTGTKGKGTTASLIHIILEANSYKLKAKSYLTGNIGKTQPLVILDDLKPEDWVVYELSSFQLQDLTRSPHIGVVLMTTSEHLDYHKDNVEYVDAKSAITKFQSPDDFAIINADFPSSVKIGELGKGKKVYFSGNKVPEFIDTASVQLRGAHNLENICAAATVAEALNVSKDIIRQAVSNFKGLEHRLEFVGEKQGVYPVKSAAGGTASQSFNGVKFYNDSFSTTPETAIAGIKAFSEPLIVILGGSKKNSDFSELSKAINESTNIKTLILIGEEAGSIKQALGQTQIPMLEGAKNMEEIFAQIKSVASSGDVVLLSPACASFGMFKNYKERGEQFKKYAKEF